MDATFLIKSLSDFPATCGGVAEVLLSKLCAHARCVDFVYDTYTSPSIKDNERHMRGANEVNIVIAGPEHKRQKHFSQALSSGLFKTSLLKFLAAEWEKDTYKEMLEVMKSISHKKKCYKFEIKR
ncbi:hypothetical protein Hamer_G002055 [Homarus americanus]|uniref:Uncharacterized protein n=1 Tax=Homarus americanus TaxID=6706 RepID=A0A8J5JRP1_HOMAM|nr:hypothetical protein Hamer_G002055 [Homarus americanus]